MNAKLECRESISRRTFLRGAACLTFAALPEFSLAASPTNGRLFVLLLRGGMDGLFAAPPIGDPGLKTLRPNLVPGGLLKLDSFFSLHPSLTNIRSLYDKGQALLVHGTSFAYTGRSHFEGQDIMESGAAKPYASPTGWLGRALDASGFGAVAMSLPVPLILRGKTPVDSRYPSWISNPPASIYDRLVPLWDSDPDISASGRQLAMRMESPTFDRLARAGQSPNLSGLAIEAATRLREANGPRVAVLDHVGFDTHASQPGQHTQKLGDIDRAIGEFRRTIGDDTWKDTLILTVTEFGRMASENGSSGTDHGWGTCIFALGGLLKKSGIVADWPGLAQANLFEGRDLKSTLDARALYAAAISATLGLDPGLVRKQVLDFTPTRAFEAYLA